MHCQGCSHKPWIVSGHKPFISLNRHFEKLRPQKQKFTRSRGVRPLSIVPCKWPSRAHPNQFSQFQLLTFAGWSQPIRLYVQARYVVTATCYCTCAKMTSRCRQKNAHHTGTWCTVYCSSPAPANSWMLACRSMSWEYILLITGQSVLFGCYLIPVTLGLLNKRVCQPVIQLTKKKKCVQR